VFTVPLPSTGHGADHIENTSSVVRIVLLPSKELYHGPQGTQLPLLRVRWNVYTETLPSSEWIRHNNLCLSSRVYKVWKMAYNAFGN
jgi:hypothetical protein